MDSNLRQTNLITSPDKLTRLKAGLLDFAIALLLCIVPVLGVAYWLCKDALFEKGSFGKRRWNLQVIQIETGQKIYRNWGLSFKRNIFTALPGINLLEWALIFLKGEGLGDRWARTEVRPIPTSI